MDDFLKSNEIDRIINDCVGWICYNFSKDDDIAIVGVRSRGVILAERVVTNLGKKFGKDIPTGTIDITLYRDDLDDPHSEEQPQVRSTEIDFDITGKKIILLDDVLYTGRTVRAAMDVLIEFGRPSVIKLAVLIDRGGRELPIQPDFVGQKMSVPLKGVVHMGQGLDTVWQHHVP